MLQPHIVHFKYRPDIDGLRAIAVLAVVAFHAFPNWLKGGFIGVDIFFVISGFLISRIIFELLDSGQFSFIDFYARRIRRIFPALALVLTASLVSGWLILLPEEYKQLGKHVSGGAGFISNFILSNELGYFDGDAINKPLLNLWSLGIEEQFYFIWPFVLWFAYQRGFNLLTLSIFIALTSLYFNLYETLIDATAAFYSPLSRFWELMAGSIVAWLSMYKTSFLRSIEGKLDRWLTAIVYREDRISYELKVANLISILGLLLLMWGFLTINKSIGFPGKWAIIPVLGAALIICSGSNSWVNRKILSNKILVWFGLISFPLYLWHWPILSFAFLLNEGVPNKYVRGSAVAISILLAWLTYVYVEKPFRFGKRSKQKTLILILVLFINAVFGVYVYRSDGLISRFPKWMESLGKPIDFLFNSYIRDNLCHLHDLKLEKHGTDCIDNLRPLIFLWGDSTAAASYPGFITLRNQSNFGIAQLTTAACLPLLELNDKTYVERKNCNLVNRGVYEKLKYTKPKLLVLQAAWYLPSAYNLDETELRQGLIKTVNQIKLDLPATSIVVIGPVPQWSISPQADTLRVVRDSMLVQEPHLFQAANQLDSLDNMLLSTTSDLGIGYISITKILCKPSGCITRVGGDSLDWVAVDRIHLSKSGSEFLAKKIQKQIFDLLKI